MFKVKQLGILFVLLSFSPTVSKPARKKIAIKKNIVRSSKKKRASKKTKIAKGKGQKANHKTKIATILVAMLGCAICYKAYERYRLTNDLFLALRDKNYKKVSHLLKDNTNFSFDKQQKRLANTLRGLNVSFPLTIPEDKRLKYLQESRPEQDKAVKHLTDEVEYQQYKVELLTRYDKAIYQKPPTDNMYNNLFIEYTQLCQDYKNSVSSIDHKFKKELLTEEEKQQIRVLLNKEMTLVDHIHHIMITLSKMEDPYSVEPFAFREGARFYNNYRMQKILGSISTEVWNFVKSEAPERKNKAMDILDKFKKTKKLPFVKMRREGDKMIQRLNEHITKCNDFTRVRFYSKKELDRVNKELAPYDFVTTAEQLCNYAT